MGADHGTNTKILNQKLSTAFRNWVNNSKTNKTAEVQAQELANEITQAIADFVKNITVQVDVTIPPGVVAPAATITTAGTPSAQVNQTPVPLGPVKLPPYFGNVI